MLTPGYLSDQIRQILAQQLVTSFNQFKLRLFQNNFSPTPLTQLSDFVECNYPGYVPLNAATPYSRDPATGNYNFEPGSASAFNCNAAVTPMQTAYGYYLTDGATAPTTLGGMGTLTQSQNFANTGDGFVFGSAVFPIRPTTGN